MELGKVPPHDIEAEQAILGCMLTDRDSVISAIEVLKEDLYYSNEQYLVTIKLENEATIEISLREYLLGCLASRYYKGIEIETLKALAILYRTYAFKEMSEKRIILSFNEFL